MRTGFVMPSSRAFFSLTRMTAAAPSPIGEHIGRVSGSAIIGDVEHVLDRERLAELGAWVQAAVERVLGRNPRELLDGGAPALHVAARRGRVDVHEHRAVLARARSRLLGAARASAGAQPRHDLGERLDIDRAAEGGEALLLVSRGRASRRRGEHDVVEAGGDHRRRLVQRRRTRSRRRSRR